MMFPSNVYVGPKARPYRGFLAQMAWKFDPHPLRQSAHWPDAWPCYAKVRQVSSNTPSKKSPFRFNNIHAAVHHRGRSSVLNRLRPAKKTSFETKPDLTIARRSERVLLRNKSPQSNARQITGGTVVYGAAVPAEIDALASFAAV
jgi:hypothetical protein